MKSRFLLCCVFVLFCPLVLLSALNQPDQSERQKLIMSVLKKASKRLEEDLAAPLKRPKIKAINLIPYHYHAGIKITPEILDDLVLLDVNTVRFEFGCEIQSEGEINYDAYDYIVKQFRSRGIDILAIVSYSSVINSGVERNSTPAYSDRYLKRLEEIVQHYSHDEVLINNWQIWNEPDLRLGAVCYVEPEAYGKMMVGAYKTIKEINEDATVVSGGLSPFVTHSKTKEENYLNKLYETTALQEFYREKGSYPFDILACHPYTGVYFNPDPKDPDEPGLASVMQQHIKSIMNDHDDGDKKVWLTELGWNSDHNNENIQRLGLVRSFRVVDRMVDPDNLDNGPYIDKYFWFMYQDWGDHEHWGVMDRTHTRRKSTYSAYYRLTQEGTPPVRHRRKLPSSRIVWDGVDDRHLKEQVSDCDLLEGHPGQLVSGILQLGNIRSLTNGQFEPDRLSAIADDGWFNKSLIIAYDLEEPATISKINVFSGHEKDGGSRTFLSVDIVIDGEVVAFDLKNGEYGSSIKPGATRAVSLLTWQPDKPVMAERTLEFRIYKTTSNSSDFRDRWSPATDPEDVDGTGPASMAPIVKEIDVFGTIEQLH